MESVGASSLAGIRALSSVPGVDPVRTASCSTTHLRQRFEPRALCTGVCVVLLLLSPQSVITVWLSGTTPTKQVIFFSSRGPWRRISAWIQPATLSRKVSRCASVHPSPRSSGGFQDFPSLSACCCPWAPSPCAFWWASGPSSWRVDCRWRWTRRPSSSRRTELF